MVRIFSSSKKLAKLDLMGSDGYDLMGSVPGELPGLVNVYIAIENGDFTIGKP